MNLQEQDRKKKWAQEPIHSTNRLAPGIAARGGLSIRRLREDTVANARIPEAPDRATVQRDPPAQLKTATARTDGLYGNRALYALAGPTHKSDPKHALGKRADQ
jgi:hypothetical protein